MDSLKRSWTAMYKDTLPALARSRSPSQTRWPVHLDHCFARIILDAVIGRGEVFDSSSASTKLTLYGPHAPWTSRLRAPAIKYMSVAELKGCIELGEAIAEGKVNLAELNERSLAVRGKASTSSGMKRKREQAGLNSSTPTPKPSRYFLERSDENGLKKKRDSQVDIRTALGALPTPAPSSPPPVNIEPDLRELIHNSNLTPFRKRVLLTLCQVPMGQVSTYLVMSDFLHSSPRAVGNALRNNPFAPRVPCHRIVAADGGIGGFAGSWGVKGEHYQEKIGLLIEEGVEQIDVKEGKIRQQIWGNFVDLPEV